MLEVGFDFLFREALLASMLLDVLVDVCSTRRWVFLSIFSEFRVCGFLKPAHAYVVSGLVRRVVNSRKLWIARTRDLLTRRHSDELILLVCLLLMAISVRLPQGSQDPLPLFVLFVWPASSTELPEVLSKVCLLSPGLPFSRSDVYPR